jgi:hypothetical protein
VEQYLGEVLGEAGVASPDDRARELIIIIEGAMAMILVHGDSSYAVAAASAAKRLFEDAVPPAEQHRPAKVVTTAARAPV